MFGLNSNWMLIIVVIVIAVVIILYVLYDDWRESIKREKYYQIILKNWKNNIRYIKISKREPNNNSIFCIRSYTILDEMEDMRDKVNHMKLHPLKQHWHIPKHIRRDDFMEFVETCTPEDMEKLMYMYSATPSTDHIYV